MIDISAPDFERLVTDALDSIPDGLMALMENVVVLVEDGGDDPDVLGLYEGTPLTERQDYGAMLELPDRITIFRHPICGICSSRDEVVHEVRVTVIHEVAHHFGIDDDRLHELGWG